MKLMIKKILASGFRRVTSKKNKLIIDKENTDEDPLLSKSISHIQKAKTQGILYTKRIFNQTITDVKKVSKRAYYDYILRPIVIVFLPISIALASIYFFSVQSYINMVLVWLFWPISTLFLWGSLKNRLLNTLPLIVGLVYLIIANQTGDYQKTLFIFYSVPLLSLVMKPKKYVFQYLTLLVSTLFLSLDYLAHINIPIYIKWLLILIIYIIFIPPFIKDKLFAGNKK